MSLHPEAKRAAPFIRFASEMLTLKHSRRAALRSYELGDCPHLGPSLGDLCHGRTHGSHDMWRGQTLVLGELGDK